MSTPVKHGAISLGIHLISVFLMLAVFKWEIYALVVGNIVFSLSMCVLNARAMRKVTGYKQEIKKTFLIPFGAAVIMGVVIVILCNGLALFMPQKIVTLITMLIAAMVYLVALLKLGALKADEIRAFPKGTTLLKILRKIHLVNGE